MSVFPIVSCLFVGFCASVLARIMQMLCKSPEIDYYGTPPLHKAHTKIVKWLKKRKLQSLVKLAYCFKCQTVWYAIFLSLVLYFAGDYKIWQILATPLVAFFLSDNYIVKDEYFKPIIDDNSDIS